PVARLSGLLLAVRARRHGGGRIARPADCPRPLPDVTLSAALGALRRPRALAIHNVLGYSFTGFAIVAVGIRPTADRRLTMSQSPSSAGQIFVVDDDPAVRDVLSMVFTRAGYEVVGFADGGSLLAAAGTRSPTCIILDVHIPGKSGLDILK